jgi:hypothetical protein
LLALPVGERAALRHAMEKLEAMGLMLGHPHTSNVQSARSLRELRPLGGASRWRALYRRIGDAFVIGAIAPDGSVDPNGFRRGIVVAEERLDAVTP